jgi:hypothetical protein
MTKSFLVGGIEFESGGRRGLNGNAHEVRNVRRAPVSVSAERRMFAVVMRRIGKANERTFAPKATVLVVACVFTALCASAKLPSTLRARVAREEHAALLQLRIMGEAIHQVVHPTCDISALGRSQYGRHDICTRQYEKPCVAISYGVQDEYSFELDIRERMGCRVFALDPTVNHKAELADGVYFLKWGAFSRATASHIGSRSSWFIAGPTYLVKAIAAENKHISILKMDCEGCEHYLYDEIIRNDRDFFERVDQFAVEFHASKSLGMAAKRDALAWGKLLVMLQKAGHRLQTVSIVHCGKDDQDSGTTDELITSGYIRPGDGHCHNYLFARSET